MTRLRPNRLLYALAIILAGALCFVRWLTPQLSATVLTAEHPVTALFLGLILAGLAWFLFILIIRKTTLSGKALFGFLLLMGLALRVMFFSSTPVYENDYLRYLWDGSVTASGEDPYRFSPTEVFEAGKAGARSVPDLTRLAIQSNEADYITGDINSPNLTTRLPHY